MGYIHFKQFSAPKPHGKFESKVVETFIKVCSNCSKHIAERMVISGIDDRNSLNLIFQNKQSMTLAVLGRVIFLESTVPNIYHAFDKILKI